MWDVKMIKHAKSPPIWVVIDGQSPVFFAVKVLLLEKNI